MERRERLNQIIRMLQESPRSSLAIKARFPRISPRTIERDIEQLALEGRIQPASGDRSRNQVWQARETIPAIEVKWMSGRAAAAIKLMQGCVSTLLPESFIDDLQPLFVKADHALRQAHNREYAEALHEPGGTGSHDSPLSPEAIRHLVHLKQAIQRKQAISLHFRRDTDQEDKHLAGASPLGLLMDDGGINLLAAHQAYPAPLRISLHAIRGLELHDRAGTLPAGLNLEDFA